jgi:beta-glucosidase
MKRIIRKNPDGTNTGSFIRSDFPKNFYWGSATSSHQIEGNNWNDWTRWELSEKRVSELKKKGLNPRDFYSGKAADSYNLYSLDFAFAKRFGHNSVRISIEWSRIEPEEGWFNQKEIDHYISVIDSALSNGLEPFVTLWHFTNPIWFADKGGWTNSKSVEYFNRYAQKVVSALKGRVKFYMTLNEPIVSMNQSYLTATWPPNKRNPVLWYLGVKNMIAAHNVASQSMKLIDPTLQISIAQHMVWSKVFKDTWFNRQQKKFVDYFMNDYFINGVLENIDYLGINYYFWNPIGIDKSEREIITKNDLGWDLVPEGLYQLVKNSMKFNKPMYITEHGLADADNTRRPLYIKESLDLLKKTINEGADVRGYLHWSLIDNFEWAEGFAPRFGLVEIAYD